MLQNLVNSAVAENLMSIKFKSRFIHNIKQVLSSHRFSLMVTKAILHKLEFIKIMSPVVRTTAEKELEKKVKRKERRRKLAEAAYNTKELFISSSDHSRTDITDRRTNLRAYYLTKEPEAELQT